MFRRFLVVAALASLTPVTACATEAPSGPTGELAITVAPLTLPQVVDACYSLEVRNELGQTVWSRAGLCADRFGDEQSSISYVGTCDATDSADADLVAQATVVLKIEALYGPDNSVAPADGDALPDALGDWQNPCAAPHAPNGCVLATTCRENADTAVTFNLTIMREANQGFFDIAVNFEDIFCSAKVDCRYPPNSGGAGAPIELVHDPLTGKRVQSIVMAFACTDGDPPGAAADSTYLYMTDVRVRCGATDYLLDPSAGPGNLYPTGAPAGPFVQAMVFEGAEQINNGNALADKLYWNLALGLRSSFFTSATPACHLLAKVTAANGPFTDGETPDNTNYPYIDVDVVVNAGAVISCSQHGLDDGNGVTTRYTGPNEDESGFASETFDHVGERVGTGIDTHEIVPDCAVGGMQAQVLADAPSGYWRLGDAVGASVVADSSGNGNVGAVLGGTITFGVPGLIGAADTAANFANSGYISVPDPVQHTFSPTGPFSIEVWLKPRRSGLFIVEKYNVPGTHGYALRMNGNRPTLYVAQSWFTSTLEGPEITLDVTHHIVATLDAARVGTIYVDGVPVASQSNMVFPELGLSITTMQIGARGDDMAGPLDGVLDEVAFYNGKALSAERVAVHYCAGGGQVAP